MKRLGDREYKTRRKSAGISLERKVTVFPIDVRRRFTAPGHLPMNDILTLRSRFSSSRIAANIYGTPMLSQSGGRRALNVSKENRIEVVMVRCERVSTFYHWLLLTVGLL